MDLLKSIEVFRRVVALESFSAAASDLNMVNSAVSRHVSELERRLNCKLLQRTTRSMKLTAEGLHYLQRFESIVSSVDELEQDVERRQNDIVGQLRITVPLHANGLHNLQPRLSEFLNRYPGVKLSWLLVNRHVHLIEEGIDLAIRVGELPDSNLVARELCKMRVYFVASPAYLDAAGTPKTPDQMAEHRCIIDSSINQPTRWIYKAERGKKHVTVSADIEVNNGELVADFAVDGFGIAYLPDFIVNEHIASGRLIRLLQPYEVGPVPVSLVYPMNRMMSPALRALIDFMLEEPITE
jgi:LysR family transcriptional regulator for bpeEF and oprC